jgi:hypothetical protein
MGKIIVIGALLSIAASGAFAASSTIDMSSGPVRKEEYKPAPVKAESVGRKVKSDADLYYVGLSRRRSDLYRDFRGCGDVGCEKTTRSARAETNKISGGRKYNLNNPFYQPMKGGFSSVTDLSYRQNSLNFAMLPDGALWQNHKGKYTADTMSVAEHLSYGITDDVTVLGSARFARNKLNIHWDTLPSPWNDDTSDGDKIKLDLWGAGVLWRFKNDSDWIASLFGAYESLTDAGSAFIGEVKAGYKNDDTTIYGFGRAMYFDWKGDMGYGFGMKNQHGQTEYFSEKENVSSSVYYDLGVGIFAALNPDWSVDAQVLYSDAEWHSQIAGRASVSYQPWINASLNLYGQVALWDSADGFDKSAVWFWQNDGTPGQRVGTAKFDKYSDWQGGIQLVLAF